MTKLINKLLVIGVLLIIGFSLLEKPTQIKILRGLEVIFDKERDEFVNFIFTQKDEDINLSEIYSEETLRHFDEVCHNSGSDFGVDQTRRELLSKWREDVVFFIEGNPEPYMVNEVDRVIDELNTLINTITIKRTTIKDQANSFIFFGPKKEFVEKNNIKDKEILKNINGCSGFFMASFRPNDRDEKFVYLCNSIILIDITTLKKVNRVKHVIREEMTQSIGFGCDTMNQPNSVFYELPSEVTEYSKIDREIIDILYNKL